MYWWWFCLFKMGFSHVIYRDSFIVNRCLVLAVSKTEKPSLEHLFKNSVDNISVISYHSFLVLKAHRSFSLVKTNLILRHLQSLLQSWSTFLCVSLECNPINGGLKYIILISDSLFSVHLSLLQFILSFKFIWLNNMIYHSKRVLILLENIFKILKIFVKTCSGIINPIHSIHQCFNWAQFIKVTHKTQIIQQWNTEVCESDSSLFMSIYFKSEFNIFHA